MATLTFPPSVLSHFSIPPGFTYDTKTGMQAGIIYFAGFAFPEAAEIALRDIFVKTHLINDCEQLNPPEG